MPVKATDGIETSLPGLLYFGSDTWIIAPDVLVSSETSDGVSSGFGFSVLINHGTILSAEGDGVSFAGANSTLINEADGQISGGNGVSISNSFASVRNFGTVTGVFAGFSFGSGAGGTFFNSGYVYGDDYGLESLSPTASAINTVINSGTIEGGIAAIRINSTSTALTTILNTGTLIGAITEVTGRVSLTNSGLVIGDIFDSGLAETTIVNTGKIVGTVFLGGGNDTFIGAGGTSGAITGGSGNDTIVGGPGADVISGRSDKDTLTGGPGADQFKYIFDFESAVGANRDRILDFKHAQHDRIDLSTIDANTILGGDQGFAFRGTLAFNGVGQVRYVKVNPAGTANDKTLVMGSTDADNAPEFQIELKGLISLVAGDFFL